MTQVTVSKFKEYPTKEPNSYAVGFSVTTDNGRVFYRDIAVSFEDVEGKTNEEITTFAYQRLRAAIENQINVEMAKDPIVGTAIDLTSLPPLEEPETPEFPEEEV